jgi:prevent-host-death family protein
MYNSNVHERKIMSISIAQSRQQLSALIDSAQSTPQVITKRNTPVAVLVSADYFKRTQLTALTSDSYYNTLIALRNTYPPVDDVGIPSLSGNTSRSAAWSRPNTFTDSSTDSE